MHCLTKAFWLFGDYLRWNTECVLHTIAAAVPGFTSEELNSHE
jgi:hypothetical protein